MIKTRITPPTVPTPPLLSDIVFLEVEHRGLEFNSGACNHRIGPNGPDRTQLPDRTQVFIDFKTYFGIISMKSLVHLDSLWVIIVVLSQFRVINLAANCFQYMDRDHLERNWSSGWTMVMMTGIILTELKCASQYLIKIFLQIF